MERQPDKPKRLELELQIRSQHDDKPTETRALRAWLKATLRTYGFRVIRWKLAGEPQADSESTP